jgi:hypothetical protein
MNEGFDFGWVAGKSVADMVGGHRDLFRLLPFIVITSIDSASRLGEMVCSELRIAGQSAPLSEDPVVVSGATLCQLVTERNMFTGFDEIWIVESLPVAAMPKEISLTAPVQLVGPPPSSLILWMQQSGWRLGLGDGYGLNFASSDRNLLRAVGLTPTHLGE